MSHPEIVTPSPAVEVVATFGDSVVGVRHVSDPTSGAVAGTTGAMLIGGAVALVAGAIAFFAATRIAAGNHAELAAWVAAGKPSWAFRPEAVPAWLSVLSFVGLSGGLTAVVAGLARRKRELEPSTVSIGSAAGVDFAVGGTATPHQRLVAPAPGGDGFAVDLTGMTGEISDAAGVRAIAPAALPLPVTRGLRVRAQLGGVGFHIAAVEAPRRQTTPLFALLDRRMLAYVAGAAAVHLALWAFARTVPPEVNGILSGFETNELTTTRLTGTVPDDVPPAIEETDDVGDASGQDGQIAMALPSGTIGDKNDDSADPAKRKIKQDADTNELARQEALRAAESAGVLGSAAADGDLFGGVVGTGPVSSGFDDIDLSGGFEGDGTGAPRGFGQNASGNAFGGGGTSFRVGGYNTIRDGAKRGEGWGISGNRGTCRATSGVCKPHVPRLPVIGKPERVSGDYDGEIIRRYVKRKLAQISYCYDKELLSKPDLSGTVMAEWTINMAGLVVAPSASGVDPNVSSCIANVISTIKFPAPPSVGVYQVRYPFVLHKPGS
jgi:hypothetical protein